METNIEELKCVEEGCWHYRERGYIYCICCLHGKCETIPHEEEKQSLSEQILEICSRYGSCKIENGIVKVITEDGTVWDFTFPQIINSPTGKGKLLCKSCSKEKLIDDFPLSDYKYPIPTGVCKECLGK